MGRHYKKAAVTPEVRRQWFNRHEMEGEPMTHIAKTEGYDIRTVKKLIDQEREVRERRDARSQVLRDAMEQHYKDLCSFARRLDTQLKGEEPIPSELREDPMWGSLKEHLPRSPIWKSAERWDSLLLDINELEAEVKVIARDQLMARSPVRFAAESQDVGLSETAADPIAFNLKASARVLPSLLGTSNVHRTPGEKGLQRLEVGAFGIGMIPEDHISEVQEVVISLLEEAPTWPQRDKMEHLLAELNRVRRVLQDELAIVILRRIVSGRCKYCPL